MRQLLAAFFTSLSSFQLRRLSTIPVYPSGPPWRIAPSDEFKGRDLTEGTEKQDDRHLYGDVGRRHVLENPVAKRMSPQLRDVMRNADTTVGNLEGGVGFDPEATASAMADLGFDFLAPGEFGGSPVLQIAAASFRQIRDKSGRCWLQPNQRAPASISGASPRPSGISPRMPRRQSLRASGHEHGTRSESARRHGVEYGDGRTIRFNSKRSRPRSSRAGTSPTCFSRPRCRPRSPPGA